MRKRKAPGTLERELMQLGTLKESEVTLKNAVLPPDALEKIELALLWAKTNHRILEDRELDAQIRYGTAVTILFPRQPGTGKTLAAKAFAGELGKKALFIRAHEPVSLWNGEDERNSAMVFRIAKEAGAVLVSDEAKSFHYARHGVCRSTDATSNARSTRCPPASSATTSL